MSKISAGKRIQREKQTVEAMIRLYCRDKHGGGELCSDCRELLDYALLRLSQCKFAEGKPTCGKCPIHCYKPALREKMIKVMKYSGPRMLRHHPLMALRHLVDGLRKVEK